MTSANLNRHGFLRSPLQPMNADVSALTTEYDKRGNTPKVHEFTALQFDFSSFETLRPRAGASMKPAAKMATPDRRVAPRGGVD